MAPLGRVIGRWLDQTRGCRCPHVDTRLEPGANVRFTSARSLIDGPPVNDRSSPLSGFAPEVGSPAVARPAAWLGWGTAAIVFGVFTVIAVASMHTGLHGDPRTPNPNPGAAPYPLFLGVTNWPLVTSAM